MISSSPISNPSGAAGYYSQQSAAAEYYSGEAIPSAWMGKGAELLGLRGPVQEKDLTAILEGRITDATGPRQLGRTRIDKETSERTREHRAGWDFTISASKSMSLAALALPDEKLNAAATAAHRAGVQAAFDFLEREAGRISAGQGGRDTAPAGLVAASYEHVLSRAGDEQLHSHLLFANVGLGEDGKAASLRERDIFRLRRAADHIYHSTVAGHMERAGHAMEFTKEGAAELVGITHAQRMEFSQRRADLLDQLAARGIDPKDATAEQRNILNLSTREDKQHVESREANKERWAEQVAAVGITTPQADKAIAREARAIDPQAQALRAVDQAIKHLAEREAVFSRIDLLTTAARFNQGTTTPEAIEAIIAEKERTGDLLRDPEGPTRYTSAAEVARVQAVAHALESGKGQHEQVMDGPQFDVALQKFEARKGFALSDEQRAAARMILCGDDQFQAVQGLAGTGKTTLLSFVREAAESRGWQIVGHSNGAAQAQTLEQESGIKSTTTARHLIDAQRDTDKQPGTTPQMRRELRIMDEASMADSREFHKVTATTQAAGARTVFLGDKLQHQSVAAGRAFEDAQRSIKPAELGEASIRRQRTDVMKGAVHDILQRDHTAALDRLEKIEVRGAQDKVLADPPKDKAALRVALREARAEDNKALISDIAKRFAALPAEKRAETIIITATNADRQAINASIRQELKLDGAGQHAHTLRAADMSKQEAKRAENYSPGQMVELQKDAGPLVKGTLLKVERIDQRANVLHCIDHQGKAHQLHPREHKLTAYTTERAEFAPGDQVKFTQNHRLPSTNGPGTEVKNGQRADVLAVTPDTLTLRIAGQQQPVQVPLRGEFVAQKMTHAYAFTSQGSQGATRDAAWMHHNPDRGHAGDRATYVNLTRARDSAVIFTTSTDLLYKQAGTKMQKDSALDIADKLQEPQREQERMREAQRVR
jgi:conjugative relaxase-like TrwC/TraI family protein